MCLYVVIENARCFTLKHQATIPLPTSVMAFAGEATSAMMMRRVRGNADSVPGQACAAVSRRCAKARAKTAALRAPSSKTRLSVTTPARNAVAPTLPVQPAPSRVHTYQKSTGRGDVLAALSPGKGSNVKGKI